MGKSVTPKYRLMVVEHGHYISPMAWNGRANEKRLADWIAKYIDSLKVGGCNEHLSKAIRIYPGSGQCQDH